MTAVTVFLGAKSGIAYKDDVERLLVNALNVYW